MLLLEFDLAGAEWVVTAYLADDPNMIAVAEGDESPHIITGSLIAGCPIQLVHREHKLCGQETDPDKLVELRRSIEDELQPYFIPRTMSIRQAGKKSNHGLNYRMRYRRFALENEMPEMEAKPIVERYSGVAYPGLQNFWRDVDKQLRKNRTLENCFGRKRRFLDQWGPDLQMAATAFIPQSTVFDVARTGFVKAYHDERRHFQLATFLAQVHDSMFYQYPLDFERMALFVVDMAFGHMQVPLRYNGHDFSLKVDLKAGFVWGKGMQSVPLTPDIDVMRQRLERLADERLATA